MGMLTPTRDRESELAFFVRWAEGQPLVRAAILTSTLTVPGAAIDRLSDYDIILVLSDIMPLYVDRSWLEAFGPVLTLYRDPLILRDGFLQPGFVVQFADGLKIDFTLSPVDWLRHITAQPGLPDELDAGYRVLLDKDQLTAGLKPPTYRAYIPKPPSAAEYRVIVENFFGTAVYAAKFLWRDDLVAAKYIFNELVQEDVRPMLEWHVEIERGWTLKPGPYGRGMKKWLHPDLWAELQATFTGPDLEENWAALYRMAALMRKAAKEVGASLGFPYPDAMDQGTIALIRQIQATAC